MPDATRWAPTSWDLQLWARTVLGAAPCRLALGWVGQDGHLAGCRTEAGRKAPCLARDWPQCAGDLGSLPLAEESGVPALVRVWMPAGV